MSPLDPDNTTDRVHVEMIGGRWDGTVGYLSVADYLKVVEEDNLWRVWDNDEPYYHQYRYERPGFFRFHQRVKVT